MIKFLNTDGLNKAIPTLIKDAKEELIIVVPFIKSSNRIYDSLKIANDKGTQITIICRLNEISEVEKNKLISLDNLNLFSHPNVHSKCYYSGESLIITSLNMTYHSEKNNKEMGVLFEDEALEYIDEYFDEEDGGLVGEKFYDDLIDELQQIINGADFIKKSNRSQLSGFSIELLETKFEYLMKRIEALNSHFAPKKFIIEDIKDYSYLVCKNFVEKFDLIIKDIETRLELVPNRGEIHNWENKLAYLHKKNILVTYKETEYQFVLYLNYGAKINIVNNEKSLEKLDFKTQLMIWHCALDKLGKHFTSSILKL